MSLFYLALFIPILPSIVAILKWSQMKSLEKGFAILLWAIVVISMSGRVWTLAGYGNNLPFYYIYILIEFTFLVQIFRMMFKEGKLSQYGWILSLAFFIVWLINVLTGQGWWVFPDKIRALEAFLLILLVILWFLKILREKTILHLYQTFEFWMCTGILIFFSGNFLLFVFSNFVLGTEDAVFKAIWKVNAILNILLYILYTVALLWVKRTIK